MKSMSKGFTNHTSEIFVAFNKEKSKSKYYSKKLDEGLKKIQESGQYKIILKQRIE